MVTALLTAALLGGLPEFQPDPSFQPAVGERAWLHATSGDGHPQAVVLGRDRPSYARHVERSFRDSAAALEAAGDDPGLAVLPYGTEVRVEAEAADQLRTGRRVVRRRLWAVRPARGRSDDPPLLVLETHLARPLSPEEEWEVARRYAAVVRANQEARAGRDALRRGGELGRLQAETTARFEDYLAARRALVTAPPARRADAQAEVQRALEDFHAAQARHAELGMQFVRLSAPGAPAFGMPNPITFWDPASAGLRTPLFTPTSPAPWAPFPDFVPPTPAFPR
jgi:hypothetical protein